jgi:hypothetical protein
MDYYEDQYMAANGPRWQRDGDRTEARKAALLEAAEMAEDQVRRAEDGNAGVAAINWLSNLASRLRTAAE